MVLLNIEGFKLLAENSFVRSHNLFFFHFQQCAMACFQLIINILKVLNLPKTTGFRVHGYLSMNCAITEGKPQKLSDIGVTMAALQNNIFYPFEPSSIKHA